MMSDAPSETVPIGSMIRSEDEQRCPDPDGVIIKGHVTHLRLLLTTWLSHFKSLGYIEESTMDMIDRNICKKIVGLTVRDFKIREAIGTNVNIWKDMVQLFHIANPSLEERSYGPLEQAGSTYDGPNSSTIVANSASLLKDLQRLDNLLAIARNVLTAGEKVQNLAAQVGFDREVCSMINLCIKITARGYDGENTSSIEEDRWQGVINGFKKLLITSLQFLSNLVTLNERLKLLLWVELFDSSLDHDGMPKINSSLPASQLNGVAPTEAVDEAADKNIQSPSRQDAPGGNKLAPIVTTQDGHDAASAYPPRKPFAAYFIFVEEVKEIVARDLIERAAAAGSTHPVPTPAALFDELSRRWKELPPEEHELWTKKYNAQMEEYKARLQEWKAAGGSAAGVEEDDYDEEFNLDQFKAHMDHHLHHHKHEDLADETFSQPETQARPLLSEEDTIEAAVNKSKAFSPLGGAKTWKQLDRALALHFPDVGRPQKDGTPQPQPDLFAPPPFAETDFTMTESARDGIDRLLKGKQQLLKRLETTPAERQQQSKSIAESDPLPLNAREQKIVEDIAAAYQDRLDNAKTQEERDAIIDERLAALTLERSKYEAAMEGTDADYGSEDVDEDEEYEEEEEEDSEEDESSDGDYAIPGEDGRGLLTDVPLILGPNEIEVLPMIIMSGIVVPDSGSREVVTKPSDDQDTKPGMNMYTIRCHLLLAQENGRNLLRELLIFVAAWDLREEELYFKFMVKIMEAILMNGLMPFAYGAFKESKDIISPAQAVIMKLLTKIFHSRQGFITEVKQNESGEVTAASGEGDQLKSTGDPAPPLRYDIQIVHCLFTEFRQQIIPQICSLMFLQGQIRHGRAALEDFPLNLWDMERMYEGVYQYLEFFAILTDHDQWKKLMADWEVASELVTLLRELELAIPKQKMVSPSQQPGQLHPLRRASTGVSADASAPAPLEPGSASDSKAEEGNEIEPVPLPKAPVSIEMPYDPNGPSAPIPVSAHPASQAPPPPPPPAGAQNNKTVPLLPTSTIAATAQPSYPSPPIHDEPADFEWRNLKKLCVLVLSSLVWKNPRLQDQVRNYGGVTAVLSCCSIDDHNPFIREHAIMCLRFLVEGNAENNRLVRSIARSGEAAAAAAAAKPEGGNEASERNASSATESGDVAAAVLAAEKEAREHAKAGLLARLDGAVESDTEGGDGLAQRVDDEGDEQHDDASDESDGAYEKWYRESQYYDTDFPVASLHVPMEVLDSHGYETFMDVNGRVGLRRKDVGVSGASQEGLGERGEYPDFNLSVEGGGQSVVLGGKKTGLLEAIGGLPA